MAILDGLAQRMFGERIEQMVSAEVERRQALDPLNYQQWVDLGIARPSNSGVTVTSGKAMSYSVVYACIRVLAETLGSLPLFVYERLERGKRRAEEHYLFRLLKDQPNEWMTSFEYRETVQAHLAAWGNAYSEIEYDGSGRVVALFPLRPDMMIQDVFEGGRRRYQYQLPNGQMRWFAGETIWHLRGLGSDGLRGYSPISMARQSIGLGLAAEEFGARFFANDARPGIVLEHPGTMGPKAVENLHKSVEEEHRPLSKKHRLMILEEGMKLHEVGIPPEDAQFLETRQFQVRDIARWFRMQPHKIADLENATFSNIEHQSIEHVVDTILPWCRRWERSIWSNLMLESDRQRFYAEFLLEGLLRGDTKSRYESYAVGRQNGWLSANDIRELENMNSIEGGDAYLVPLNMVVVGEEPDQQPGRSIEIRSLPEERAVNRRRQLMLSEYEPMAGTLRGIYRREIKRVGSEWKKAQGQRQSPEFMLWLQEFYQEQKTWMVDFVTPVFLAYALRNADAAGDEVDHVVERLSVENFTAAYAASFADRQVAYSQVHIEQALAEENPDEALTAEFDNWIDVRAISQGQGEAIQQANAVAGMVFADAGVLRKTWRSFGENCPYCTNLNGRTVEIGASFLSGGLGFLPEGADGPLTPSVDVGHPPAHGGCDCMIVSGG